MPRAFFCLCAMIIILRASLQMHDWKRVHADQLCAPFLNRWNQMQQEQIHIKLAKITQKCYYSSKKGSGAGGTWSTTWREKLSVGRWSTALISSSSKICRLCGVSWSLISCPCRKSPRCAMFMLFNWQYCFLNHDIGWFLLPGHSGSSPSCIPSQKHQPFTYHLKGAKVGEFVTNESQTKAFTA